MTDDQQKQIWRLVQPPMNSAWDKMARVLDLHRAAGHEAIQIAAKLGSLLIQMRDLDGEYLTCLSITRAGVVHKLYFGETDPKKLVKIDKAVCTEIQAVLKRLGYYKGEVGGVYDEATRKALSDWQGWENLEMRGRTDDSIDGVVLDYIKEHYGDQK